MTPLRRSLQLLPLAALLALGLVLRLAHARYGLPFVWNLDERTHFVNRAVQMFNGDFDPGYYQNPAAFTYLAYLWLRFLYGGLGFWFPLEWGTVPRQFSRDPTEIWLAARALAALLSLAGVAALYFVALRTFGRAVALVAAALLSFAFLPVAYGRIAVTDSGALAGSALAVGGAAAWVAHGRARWLVTAGAAVGIACAFKYTTGLLAVPVLAAALLRRGAVRRGLAAAAAGLALGALLFAAANPYLFVNFATAWRDLREQAAVAGLARKAGQAQPPPIYYLDSLRWGFGLVASGFAVAGAIALWRRDRRLALVVAVFPLLLFLWLSAQSRAFARWLLPAYPQLALLAGVGIVHSAGALAARVRALRRRGDAPMAVTGSRGAAVASSAPQLATVALAAIALLQPLTADLHQLRVAAAADTRELLREWLVRSGNVELRAVVEPAVPERWYVVDPTGVLPRWVARCADEGGFRHPGWRVQLPGYERCARGKPAILARPDGALAATNYYRALYPRLIDQYRFYGYCTVITMSLVRDRAERASAAARAYYRRLDRESTVVRRFSPYRRGARPVPFHFDHSYLYYPRAYARPGPLIEVRRLRRCEQRRGLPIVRLPIAPDDRPAPGNEV